MSAESDHSNESDLIVVDTVSEEEIIVTDEKSDQLVTKDKTESKALKNESLSNSEIKNGKISLHSEPLVKIIFHNKQLADLCQKHFENFIRTHVSRDKHLNNLNSDPIVMEIHPDFALDNSISLADIDDSAPLEIPLYNLSCDTIMQDVEIEPEDQPLHSTPINSRRGPKCFNCGGEHMVSACKERLDSRRIQMNKKNMVNNNSPNARYHADPSSKCGNPGEISNELKAALGLKPSQAPLYIYRMRVLGYPPGWLQDSIPETSGITIFDSTGEAINSSVAVDEQPDPSKTIKYPGFNTPFPSHIKDDHKMYGLPAFDHDSNSSNKRQKRNSSGRKRKPSHSGRAPSKEIHLDDNGEAPIVILSDDDEPHPSQSNITSTEERKDKKVVVDDEISIHSSHGSESPSLSDLEAQKNKLQMQLNDEVTSTSKNHVQDIEKKPTTENQSEVEVVQPEEVVPMETDDPVSKEVSSTNTDKPDIEEIKPLENNNTPVNSTNGTVVEIEEINMASDDNSEQTKNEIQIKNNLKSPPRAIKSISCSIGTPMLYDHSLFSALPDASKFAEGISDHIPYENLPQSTGTFEKMRGVLDKVKKNRASLGASTSSSTSPTTNN